MSWDFNCLNMTEDLRLQLKVTALNTHLNFKPFLFVEHCSIECICKRKCIKSKPSDSHKS